MLKFAAKSLLTIALLFSFCTNKPEIDNNLYGSWLVIGYKYVADDITLSEKPYSVNRSLNAYRISNSSITEFIRGVDYSGPPLYGTVEYLDSIEVNQYDASIDESTISVSGSGKLSYSLRFECGAHFLKLIKVTTGMDRNYRTVTVEMSSYCIKILNDSLPASWPSDEDVLKPDSTCDPGDLIYW